MRRIFVGLCVALTVSGCASTVAKRDDLFSENKDRKECYTYDTLDRNLARNAPASVGLGIIGGLFPPLFVITAIAAGTSGVADEAALPSKCGLTFDEAVREATSVSFYERATAIWKQKVGNASIAVKYLGGDNDCSNHRVTLIRQDGQERKRFVEEIEVCRNEQGEPMVKGPASSQYAASGCQQGAANGSIGTTLATVQCQQPRLE